MDATNADPRAIGRLTVDPHEPIGAMSQTQNMSGIY
mgnify:CR=1 FL=1